jgi:hypothetical protein
MPKDGMKRYASMKACLKLDAAAGAEQGATVDGAEG